MKCDSLETIRRIAILDLNSIGIASQTANIGDAASLISLSKRIEKWVLYASKKHMDACYVRGYSLPRNLLEEIVKTLKSNRPDLLVIVPLEYLGVTNLIDAVHLRENDEFPKVFLDREKYLVGKSCHTLESIRAAEKNSLDYVFFSPVFKTKTHPEAEAIGISGLENACNYTALPVYALGGITPENEQQCRKAGAYGVAAIGMFME